MTKDKNTRLFEDEPIFSAFLKLAVPTMIGQIILVIYNMADTFFIGMTGSDAMITAVSVCTPAFMFLSAISNLFGVGGSAVIARSLGRGEERLAKYTSAFSFWGCVAMTLFYSALAGLFIHPYVNILGGAFEAVHVEAVAYLRITVVFCGVFAAVNTLLAHLVRSVGYSLQSSIGIAFGGILNILLDPLFMFVILPPGHEVVGAAIATSLSNAMAVLYFAVLLRVRRAKFEMLSFRYTKEMFSKMIPQIVLANGLPACLMTFCENVSYAVLDRLMFAAGTVCQAGLGVAKKVNMLAHCMVRGVAQGALPLIAYNYGAENHRRMRGAIISSIATSLVLSMVCLVTYYAFSPQLIGIFIRSGSRSANYGAAFLRILCIGCPFSAVAYSIISFYQAIGLNKRSLLLALLRKGLLDIPLMFILRNLIPLYGIVWATPIADMICCVVALILFAGTMRRLKKEMGAVAAVNGSGSVL